MGFQKIAQMRAELNEKLDAAEEIIKTAQTCAENHRKIAEQYKKIEDLREAQWKKAMSLNTLGIKALNEYKDAVISQCASWENPLPSPAAVHKYIADQRREVDEVVQAHLAKLASSFPSQVTAGMKFQEGSSAKTIWEVKEEYKAPNLPIFRGKTGPFYLLINEQGKTSNATLADLKSKYKYLKI